MFVKKCLFNGYCGCKSGNKVFYSADIHWHSHRTETHCTHINLSPQRNLFTFLLKTHHLNTDTHTCQFDLSILFLLSFSPLSSIPCFQLPWAHFLRLAYTSLAHTFILPSFHTSLPFLFDPAYSLTPSFSIPLSFDPIHPLYQVSLRFDPYIPRVTNDLLAQCLCFRVCKCVYTCTRLGLVLVCLYVHVCVCAYVCVCA